MNKKSKWEGPVVLFLPARWIQLLEGWSSIFQAAYTRFSSTFPHCWERRSAVVSDTDLLIVKTASLTPGLRLPNVIKINSYIHKFIHHHFHHALTQLVLRAISSHCWRWHAESQWDLFAHFSVKPTTRGYFLLFSVLENAYPKEN